MQIQVMDVVLDEVNNIEEGFAFGGSVADASILKSSFLAAPGAFISVSDAWQTMTNVEFTTVMQQISGVHPTTGAWLPTINIVGVSAIKVIPQVKLDGIIGVFETALPEDDLVIFSVVEESRLFVQRVWHTSYTCFSSPEWLSAWNYRSNILASDPCPGQSAGTIELMMIDVEAMS